VGAETAPVGAKVASVETVPVTDGSASGPAETKVVPVGKFVALRPGRRHVATSDNAVEETAASTTGRVASL